MTDFASYLNATLEEEGFVTDSRYTDRTRFQSAGCERAIVSSELQIMGHIISAAATGLVLQCFVLLGSAPPAFAQSTVTAQNSTNFGETLWVTTTQRIKSKIYENAQLSRHPILVVVVHGGCADGSPSTYHYRFAERAAAAIPDAVVAAVLPAGLQRW